MRRARTAVADPAGRPAPAGLGQTAEQVFPEAAVPETGFPDEARPEVARPG